MADTVADSVVLNDGGLGGTGNFFLAYIPAFIVALVAGTLVPAGDIDRNGQLDFDDIPAFILLLQG